MAGGGGSLEACIRRGVVGFLYSPLAPARPGPPRGVIYLLSLPSPAWLGRDEERCGLWERTGPGAVTFENDIGDVEMG